MIRKISAVAWLVAMMTFALTACNSQPSIPPLNQFTQRALGTPIPPEMSAVPVNLPPDGSGVAFYNQKGTLIHVVLSDSVRTISPTYGFLFPLTPGIYNFYIYEDDGASSLQTENVEPGKVRYVYIYPFSPDRTIH